MRVICRKANGATKEAPQQVVMEVWMSKEEAILHSYLQPLTDLEETEQKALVEHLKTGHRVSHTVTRGRPL